MTAPKLSFFKLIVEDLDAQSDFYQRAFGMSVQDVFDTPDFGEVILKQADTDVMLILLAYKDGRPLPDAASHGPTGFVTIDMDATHGALVAAGATPKGPIMDVDTMRVAFLDDPEGHEIEIVQF